jgi:hypothetical protein
LHDTQPETHDLLSSDEEVEIVQEVSDKKRSANKKQPSQVIDLLHDSDDDDEQEHGKRQRIS